jgi:general secretion pathway protein E
MAKMRIGDRLIQEGLITQEQLVEALEVQKTLPQRKKIIVVLTALGHIDKDKLLEFFVEQSRLGNLDMKSILEDFPADEVEILERLAHFLKIDFIDLDSIDLDFKLIKRISLAQLQRFKAIPIKESDFDVVIAFKDPFDLNAKDLLQRMFKQKPIKMAIAKSDSIDRILSRIELNDSIQDLVEKIKVEISTANIDTNADESSNILKLIEIIFKNAVLTGTSDIHIEPSANGCIVRTRIDGILVESFVLEEQIYPILISRLKLLADLDIGEKRKPQDGRISMNIMDKEIDFRVSTLPTLIGESIVMRILDKSKVMINLSNLGLSKNVLTKFEKAMKSPYGMIFVTGPTGSGKTTTLYAALNAIKSVEKKIITVEDPVEYQLNMIQQTQVNTKVGLTFASILKTILRQDPDIIMIGEVRDKETLRIAIQSALTGHLVFSTLHTNDAISSITRLLDMGIESYFISSSVVAIAAQRLVRQLCPVCREATDLGHEMLESIREYLPESYQFYKARGCNKCSMTGYKGRAMVSEVLEISEEIQRLVAKKASESEILETAISEGFVTMYEDGILKACEGMTTIDEVLRVAKL